MVLDTSGVEGRGGTMPCEPRMVGGADVAKIGNRNRLLGIISQVDGNLNSPYYWGGWSNKCQEVIAIPE